MSEKVSIVIEVNKLYNKQGLHSCYGYTESGMVEYCRFSVDDHCGNNCAISCTPIEDYIPNDSCPLKDAKVVV